MSNPRTFNVNQLRKYMEIGDVMQFDGFCTEKERERLLKNGFKISATWYEHMTRKIAIERLF